ncbi:MAG: NUDIX hydrolase, partial [Clostridia bacterium]
MQIDKSFMNTNIKESVRTAVRAVVIEKDKILLIRTSRGDYKFLGGAIEKNEIAKDALTREVREESGYKACSIIKYLGRVIEKRQDKYDSQLLFKMISEYYLSRVGDKGKLELSEN